MSNYTLRRATSQDAHLLIEAILAAERLPLADDRSMYEALLGFDRRECMAFLQFALGQNVAGHQLSYDSFRVLCCGGEPAACCATWIEGVNAAPSSFAVAMLMASFLGKERWAARAPALRIVSATVPKRTQGYLQLETFFVAPRHRGQGLVTRLINEIAFEHSVPESAAALTAEIVLFRENQSAIRAYRAAGFLRSVPTADASSEFIALTGSRGYLHIQRDLTLPFHDTPENAS